MPHHLLDLPERDKRILGWARISNRSINEAIEYLRPANVRGGISSRPNLMITNEEDQSTVTNNASRTAKMRVRLESWGFPSSVAIN